MTGPTGKKDKQGGGKEPPNLLDMDAYRKQKGARGNAMSSFRQQYYARGPKDSADGKKKSVGHWRGRLVIVFQALVVAFGFWLLMRGCGRA